MRGFGAAPVGAAGPDVQRAYQELRRAWLKRGWDVSGATRVVSGKYSREGTEVYAGTAVAARMHG